MTSRAFMIFCGACFLVATAYLALHPDHAWHEVFGEPESHPVEIELEPVRV